ncbi:hypothetical protein [Hasllibacter sp. MH4015]|uniref:hypothetical protein n=1 Tax=Hasllibacter sp. MH4015 TaxID=2854029 RepID=UPI001CD66C21|nr:hypothetical protein [Hasllibacter sp. MH4015]
MAKSKLCLFFVVDGEKLEAQACLLAASIRRHMPKSTPVIAYHRQDYELSSFVKSFLKRCKVTLVPLPDTGPDDPNPWSRPWPVGNKNLAKAQKRDCDISVYLDTDMVMMKPVDFEAELGDGEVLACVADYSFGALNSPEAWREVYEFFGMDLPEERIALLAGRKLELPPYFNGGFSIFREKPIGKTKEHFGEAWLADCLKLDHADGFDDAREGLDQTIYPITIRRIGAKFTQGRQAINYNVQAHGVPSGEDIAIAHYHTFGTILRHHPSVGYAAVMNIEHLFGKKVTREFIDTYGEVLAWAHRKFVVPGMVERHLADGRLHNLSDLAALYGSDKGPSKHRYTELYQMLFWPYANRKINFLEMGLLIGGPEHSISKDRETRDCPSIRMWLDFFSTAKIHGLDVSDFSWFKHERFEFFRCDMDTRENIVAAADKMPAMDIIIDDASHASHHQQNGFLELFPRLKSGGLYIIEDLRWQPGVMEQRGITKTGDLFDEFQRTRKFKHSNPEIGEEFNALVPDISGCFVFQENYDRSARHQVAVIHKR